MRLIIIFLEDLKALSTLIKITCRTNFINFKYFLFNYNFTFTISSVKSLFSYLFFSGLSFIKLIFSLSEEQIGKSFATFMITKWLFIRAVLILYIYALILDIIWCMLFDYYDCFVGHIASHRETLLTVYDGLHHNYIVMSQTQNIVIQNTFKHNLNLFFLEHGYGIDKHKIELIYKYHLLKDVSLGSSISPPERLYVPDVSNNNYCWFNSRQMERIVIGIFFASTIFILLCVPGPRGGGNGGSTLSSSLDSDFALTGLNVLDSLNFDSD